MTAGTLMSNGVNPWVSCLVALLMSLAIGLVNGVLVAKVGLPSFIATLGTMTLARGLAQLVKMCIRDRTLPSDGLYAQRGVLQ